MLRSMMQMYVKGSVQAVGLYQKAFHAEILCLYPDERGGYMHAELNAHGQILAVSELGDQPVAGNTMQFCFHFGEGGEEHVKNAYEVLKEGAVVYDSIGPCGYSPCMCSLTDKFGVSWCLFV